MIVRPYRDEDEEGWLRCRALSFLHTAFYDDVRREKEHYEHPSVELVAEDNGEIVGLIDVELEAEGTGMIWHIAVHPDHQGRGIGTALLREVERGLTKIQAWTRDDAATQHWYESRGFVQVEGYLHVYVEFEEGLRNMWPPTEDGLRPVKVFAHYTGDDRDAMRARFKRVHDDVLYEKKL